jgi:hypothetical protein
MEWFSTMNTRSFLAPRLLEDDDADEGAWLDRALVGG